MFGILMRAMADSIESAILAGELPPPSGAPALIDATQPDAKPRTLSFAWLAEHVALLAEALRRTNVLGRQVVGLLSERSAEQVAGIFAVWRVGAVYLPLDLGYPRERILWMVEDAKPAALLLSRAAAGLAAGYSGPTLLLESGAAAQGSPDQAKAVADTLPDGCCYVLYSSGSTGLPKGVLGARRGLAARCTWMWEAYPFAPDEVCVAKTPLGFVDSLWEMVGPLAKGVPLLLLPSDAASRPHALLPALREWRVSRLLLVPSALRMLLDACDAVDEDSGTPPAPPPPAPPPPPPLLPSLRVLSVSGDALPWALCVRVAALLPHVRLLNLYGCTETSADATAFDVTAAIARGSTDGVGGCVGVGVCPLGAPISGSAVWLLRAAPAEADGGDGDGDGDEPAPSAAEECAAGEVGEIGVGGDVVALGYLHRPRLAAAKFAQLGLRSGAAAGRGADAPGAAVAATTTRVFRTGDLGRWGARGELCFLGRTDRQLQLRGARLEPREVEAAYEGFAQAPDAAAHALAVPLLLSDDATGGADGGLRSADGLALCVVLRAAHADDGGGGTGEPDGSADGVGVLVGASRRLSAALRRWGEARLPAWMVPSAFVVVDVLPCLPSGKPDRLRLQQVAPQLLRLLLEHGARQAAHAADADDGGSDGEAADGPVRLLCAEMGRLLGVADGLPAASRFVESGGSSVLAARLSFELRRQGWHLPPEALMRRDATVASAASAMTRLGAAGEAGSGQREGGEAARASEEAEAEAEGGAAAGARSLLASWLHVAGMGKTEERAADEPTPYDEAAPPLLGEAMELRPQAAGEPRTGSHAWSLGRAAQLVEAAPPPAPSSSTPQPMAPSPPPPPPLPPCSWQLAWRADLGKCVDASPVLACRVGGDGQSHSVTAFVGSHAGLLQAIDLRSGAVLWSAQLSDRLEASCAVSPRGDAVVVGCHDARLYALCAHSGAELWRYQAHGQIKASACCLPAPAAARAAGGSGGSGGGADGGDDGSLVVCACYGARVAALRLSDGGQHWLGAIEGPAFASPLADLRRRRLYVADLRGALHCFGFEDAPRGDGGDSGDGDHGGGGAAYGGFAPVWVFHTSARRGGNEPGCEPIFSSPTLDASSGAVYFGCMDGLLYAVAPEGTPLWTFDAAGPIFSAPCAFTAALGASGELERRLLITSQSGRVLCVEAAHGALRWAQPAEVHGHSSPAVDTACAQHGGVAAEEVAARVAVVGGVDGRLHAFDCASGAPLGTTRLPGAVFSSAALCAGRVVVGCRDDFLYCLALRTQRSTAAATADRPTMVRRRPAADETDGGDGGGSDGDEGDGSPTSSESAAVDERRVAALRRILAMRGADR